MVMSYSGPLNHLGDRISDPIDPGTTALVAHRSPRHRHRYKKPLSKPIPEPPIPIVVFHYRVVLDFLRSVARTTIMEKHVSVTYEKIKDPTWVERFMFFRASLWAGTEREPGVSSIGFGDPDKIRGEVDDLELALFKTFLARFSRGAESATRFLEEQESARARYAKTIDYAYTLAKDTNKAFADDLRIHAKILIATKCASTIVFKAVGAVVEGWAQICIDIGYDVSVSVITEWNDTHQAHAAVIAGVGDAGMDAVQDVTEAIADKSVEVAGTKGERALAKLYLDLLKETEDHVLQDFLAGSHAVQNTLTSFPGKRLMQAAGRGLGKGLTRGVKALWFARDLKNAYYQAHKEWDEVSK
jgi:hypothetical protein